MAATFLAKLNGADAAATAFGIDPRTVRSWLGTVEVADDSWTAIRDVLLARGAEMAALGKTAGLPAILTGAGISDRNVRYGQLIARREAGRAADAEVSPRDRRKQAWRMFLYPNSGPERVAVVEEDETRLHRYHNAATESIAEELRGELNRRAYEKQGEPYEPEAEDFGDRELLAVGIWTRWRQMADESDDDMTKVAEWIVTEPPAALPAELAVPTEAMSDEEFTAYLAKLRVVCIAKAHQWWPSYEAAQETEREREQEREQARRIVATPPAEPPALVAEPTPLPTARMTRPKPVPMVFDGTDADHDRGWYPLERKDY